MFENTATISVNTIIFSRTYLRFTSKICAARQTQKKKKILQTLVTLFGKMMDYVLPEANPPAKHLPPSCVIVPVHWTISLGITSRHLGVGCSRST
jgi:hypothetical protein